MKKRLLMLMLAGCMVLGMTACGEKKETTKPNQEEAAGSEENEETKPDTSALGTSTLKELGEYKGLTYKPMETVVTDEEVEKQVQAYVKNSVMKNPQETVTETSFVNIDYVGKKDGTAFDGGSAENQELSIENSGYIPGFAESIVGMKVGETKDCPMTFPEDYKAEELAGADVVFTITVNECWENVPAQLNDEFAVSQGYENVDDLYVGMRKLFEQQKLQTAQADKEYQLIQAVADRSSFDLTEEEIALYADQLKQQYQMYAYYSGTDMETYLKDMLGLTMDEFEKQCREIAIYRIQTPLVLSAVAQKEGLTVSEEEYSTRAEEYMNYYGYQTLEELEKAYTKEMVEEKILNDIALELLEEHATAEE